MEIVRVGFSNPMVHWYKSSCSPGQKVYSILRTFWFIKKLKIKAFNVCYSPWVKAINEPCSPTPNLQDPTILAVKIYFVNK